MHYRDLLNADGTTNHAVAEKIAAGNAKAEINLALCVDAGLRLPARILYSQVRGWYAEQAAKLKTARLSVAERRKIWAEARADVATIIRNMRSARAEKIAARSAA